MNLYLVHMTYPARRVATSPGCVKTAWKYRRLGPYPVAASNPVEAAELFLARIAETSPQFLERYSSCAVYVCQHVWDGRRGFKVAANTNGDIRYDIRKGADGSLFPVHSEKSWA